MYHIRVYGFVPRSGDSPMKRKENHRENDGKPGDALNICRLMQGL